jgi:hypothetical protein
VGIYDPDEESWEERLGRRCEVLDLDLKRALADRERLLDVVRRSSVAANNGLASDDEDYIRFLLRSIAGLTAEAISEVEDA